MIYHSYSEVRAHAYIFVRLYSRFVVFSVVLQGFERDRALSQAVFYEKWPMLRKIGNPNLALFKDWVRAL